MRTFSRTNQFRKDVKLARRRGKDLAKLKAVLDLLIEGDPCRSNAESIPCVATLRGAATAILNRIGC